MRWRWHSIEKIGMAGSALSFFCGQQWIQEPAVVALAPFRLGRFLRLFHAAYPCIATSPFLGMVPLIH